MISHSEISTQIFGNLQMWLSESRLSVSSFLRLENEAFWVHSIRLRFSQICGCHWYAWNFTMGEICKKEGGSKKREARLHKRLSVPICRSPSKGESIFGRTWSFWWPQWSSNDLHLFDTEESGPHFYSNKVNINVFRIFRKLICTIASHQGNQIQTSGLKTHKQPFLWRKKDNFAHNFGRYIGDVLRMERMLFFGRWNKLMLPKEWLKNMMSLLFPKQVHYAFFYDAIMYF